MLTEVADLLGTSGMHDLRGQQPETGVMVLGVVPGEELLAEAASVFLGAKSVRELRAVLQGFELAFRKRVVVGDVWATVGLGHAEVSQQ